MYLKVCPIYSYGEAGPVTIRLDGVGPVVAVQLVVFAVPGEIGRWFRQSLAHKGSSAIDIGVL